MSTPSRDIALFGCGGVPALGIGPNACVWPYQMDFNPAASTGFNGGGGGANHTGGAPRNVIPAGAFGNFVAANAITGNFVAANAIGIAQIGSNVLASATLNLTGPNIANLGTAIPIIGAPGAGVALIPAYFDFAFSNGATPFDSGGAIQFIYHGASTDLSDVTIANTIVTAAGANFVTVNRANTIRALSNTGIDIKAASSYGNGTGSAVVTLWYRTIAANTAGP